MRDLAGPAAFEQLQAQLARSAACVTKGRKSARGRAAEAAVSSPDAESDDEGGEAAALGTG
ncbi:hypothetical protein [Streptomyces sp. Tue6028]|uniref:hypothetical protein n=1 Tax=Streptomyces sp. Tue6028 TaxID=2036037 RepID=UPI00117DD02F|nr:hypothetical protein [Streptomyces sp. Tue6028]